MIFYSPRQQFHLIIWWSITLLSIPANVLQPAASSLKPCPEEKEWQWGMNACCQTWLSCYFIRNTYLGTSVKVKVYINLVRSLCFYDGIARLSLPRMLAWRQTLPKVLHRWNYIFQSLQQFHLIITWNMPFIFLNSSLCPLTSGHSSQLLLWMLGRERVTMRWELFVKQKMFVGFLVTFFIKIFANR